MMGGLSIMLVERGTTVVTDKGAAAVIIDDTTILLQHDRAWLGAVMYALFVAHDEPEVAVGMFAGATGAVMAILLVRISVAEL